jgi:hypothetical protein
MGNEDADLMCSGHSSVSEDNEHMPVSSRQPGTKSEDEPTQNILAMNISGGAAGVSINFTNGDPLPVGGFYFDAAIVELDGPHGSDPLVTSATAAMIGNDVIRYSPTTVLTDNLTSDGGILAITGTTNLNNEAGDSLIVAPGATVFVNGSQTFASLTIDAGATVRQISQNTTFGASVITVGSVSLQDPDTSDNGGGVLDLGNGDLIVKGAEASDVATLLANGFDNGFWDGVAAAGPNLASIVSLSAANDLSEIQTLGYGEIGSAAGELDITQYDGLSVATGDVVVALTYSGDANLDRSVDDTDISMFENGLSNGLTGWTNGDFNYDGVVDSQDESYQTFTLDTLSASPDTATTHPASQPTVEIHLNGNLADTVTIPNGPGTNNEDAAPIQVTATSNGQAVNVPKWTVRVTQNGKPVNAGWFYFVEKHSEGNVNDNQFTISASSLVKEGKYTVTVEGPGGQTQTMTLTATKQQ